MPDPAPLELKPDELKQIRKGLEDIGETLNVAVDEQNSDIENKDEQTEKIIKDNIIDKTRIILKPDEKKRYLAISKIFIDEWMSQVKILKESEKKKGLLSGAISLVKKTDKKAWDLMKLPFWWLNKDKKEDESSPWWEKILKLLAGIGVFWFLFGDNIKNLIPDNIKESLKTIGEAIKTEVLKVVNTAWDWIKEKVPEWWGNVDKDLGLSEIWKDIKETCATIRAWIEHPWKGLAKELAIDNEEISQEASPESEETPHPTVATPPGGDVKEVAKVVERSNAGGAVEQMETVSEKKDELEARLKNQINSVRKKPVQKEHKQEVPSDSTVAAGQIFLHGSNTKTIDDMYAELDAYESITPVTEAANMIVLKDDTMESIKDVCLKMVGFFGNESGGSFSTTVQIIVGSLERRLRELATDISNMEFQVVNDVSYSPTYHDTYDQSDKSKKEIINDYSKDNIEQFEIEYNHVDFGAVTAMVESINNQEKAELEHLRDQTNYLSHLVTSIDGLSKDLSQFNVGAEAAALNMQGYTSTALPNSPFNVPNTEFLRDAQKKYAVVFNDNWKETYGGIQTT